MPLASLAKATWPKEDECHTGNTDTYDLRVMDSKVRTQCEANYGHVSMYNLNAIVHNLFESAGLCVGWSHCVQHICSKSEFWWKTVTDLHARK